MRTIKPENRIGPETSSSGLQRINHIYAFWGHHPAIYAASDYLTFLGRPSFIRSRAVQALGLKKTASVLELGCGTGRNLAWLRQAVEDHGKIVGFDFSREMLKAADALVRKNGWRNVTFIQGDAARLHLGEPCFDGILSVLAVSAIPDWREALMRCHDALLHGGVLSVCDARMFQGPLRVLNPIIKLLYRKLAAWDPTRDITGRMKDLFGNVRVERYNLGTFFVATSVKHEDK